MNILREKGFIHTLILSKGKKLVSGFSLVELLVIISIMILIGLVVMPKLISFQRNQAIQNTATSITSLLNKAKSDSNSSLNSNNYGVHFESEYMVYFVGNTYSESDPNNQRVDFDSGVRTLGSGGVNLNGGGDDIVFPRRTEDVIGYGTIVIQLIAEESTQKTITVSKIGSISSS